MTGSFIDTYVYRRRVDSRSWQDKVCLIATDFGSIRVLDTGGYGPVILNIPDGPNVIEHHKELIAKLSQKLRVICFELPGIGFSYPNSKYDYSFSKASKLIINLMDILEIDKAALAFSCSNGLYAIKTAELYPERISRLFLSQTPSLASMNVWTNNAIPKILKYPIIGQIVNLFSAKKFAKVWYKYALPKNTDLNQYQDIALHSLNNGGCFVCQVLCKAWKRIKIAQ